jgi:hypothetical protein
MIVGTNTDGQAQVTPAFTWMVCMAKLRFLTWVAPAVLALGSLTAAGKASAQPLVVIENAAPPQVESYPSFAYQGRPVYDVNGRFYVREGRGWAYYRVPPEVFWRYRLHEARVARRSAFEARVAARDSARAAAWDHAARVHEARAMQRGEVLVAPPAYR